MFDDFEDMEEIDDASDASDISVSAGLPPPRDNPELFGHEEIESALLKLYNGGTLPHAMIFAGPMGVGKSTAAFRLARFIFKHGAGGDDDQGGLFGDAPPPPTSLSVPSDDPVARKVASGGHPDLRFIERPVERGVKKTVVDVETVREIAPFLRKTTADGGWRVVIVDEADRMNRNAQNAILKILEEPPPKALLILVCNRLGAMLPTIRSRCRTFHFGPLDGGQVRKLFERAVPDLSPDDRDILAALSDGSIGRALSLEQDGGANIFRTTLAFIEDWPDWPWTKIHPWADNVARGDADREYAAFTISFDWICRAFLYAKATGKPLPKLLRAARAPDLLGHYSLEQWIDICDKLKSHFIAIEASNLDRKQGVIGAYAILGGQ